MRYIIEAVCVRQALARNLGSFHLCKSSFPLHSGLFILKSRWREEKGERQGRRKTEIDSDSAHSPWGVFGSEVSMKAIFFFSLLWELSRPGHGNMEYSARRTEPCVSRWAQALTAPPVHLRFEEKSSGGQEEVSFCCAERQVRQCEL